MQKQNSKQVFSVNALGILVPSAVLWGFLASQVYAEPLPLLTPATKPITTLEQKQVGKLPAGTEASFVVVNSGSNSTALVQENQPVVLPIAGKLGNKDIPKDSVLVGTLKRLTEKSGVFEFTKLVLGTRVYAVKMKSESVNGRLMQDPKAMQAMMSDMQGVTSGLPTAEEIQKKQDAGMARAAASMAPDLLSGFIPGGELLSGAARAAQSASEADERKRSEAEGAAMTARIEAMMKKLQTNTAQTPSILFAEIAPLQPLKMKFLESVDLNTPVATLSAPMKAQGVFTESDPGSEP
ncbi:MAG: hypothetical protein H7Y37_19665 [Anaerolineae bacterium]|nr:hypothetical protein [Gloeobacterales cyanobacterium ES-bin-313]